MIFLSVIGVFFFFSVIYFFIDILNIMELDDRLGFIICCFFVLVFLIVMGIVVVDMWGNLWLDFID